MDNYQIHLIALKTLKQRCEFLQERLKTVEEENCKLKLEMTQDVSKKISKESSDLEEQIIILTKEKSQMTHQIQMIIKENFTLWSYLSKVVPESNIPSLKLSVYADQDPQLKLSQYGDVSDDYNKQSLEEISLKLVNGIIMNKNELEKQYFKVIDLHNKNIVGENSSLLSKQLDGRAAVKHLKDYVQKLKEFKQALYKQKIELSSAITIVKNSKVFLKGIVSNPNDVFQSHNKESDVNSPVDFEFLSLQDYERTENKNEQLDPSGMICPMCGKIFTGEFRNFYAHVSNHFDSENDKSVDSRTDFESVQ